MPNLKLKFKDVHDTNRRQLAKKIVEKAKLFGYECSYNEEGCSINCEGQRPGVFPNEMIEIDRDNYFEVYQR